MPSLGHTPYTLKPDLHPPSYAGRWNLVNFPPVLGLKSYFLDVPELSGYCSIVKDGVIRCQLGSGCPPINHELPQVRARRFGRTGE